MKRLLLLRHAKSDWADPGMRDFDRGLTERGNRAADRMGRYLRDEALMPDSIICSPAARTRQTLDGLALDALPDVRLDDRLYMATAETLLDVIHAAQQDARTLLLVGHNPGLEDLAALLAGSGPARALSLLAAKFPTTALAVIDFEAPDWAGVTRKAGRLDRFVLPRTLDRQLDDD